MRRAAPLFALLLVAGARPASACQCLQGMEDRDVPRWPQPEVFTAEVIGVQEGGGPQALLRVLRTFAGSATGDVEVVVDSQVCGGGTYRWDKGGTYVVAARKVVGGLAADGSCWGTRELARPLEPGLTKAQRDWSVLEGELELLMQLWQLDALWARLASAKAPANQRATLTAWVAAIAGLRRTHAEGVAAVARGDLAAAEKAERRATAHGRTLLGRDFTDLGLAGRIHEAVVPVPTPAAATERVRWWLPRYAPDASVYDPRKLGAPTPLEGAAPGSAWSVTIPAKAAGEPPLVLVIDAASGAVTRR